jgi:hypothetical protein
LPRPVRALRLAIAAAGVALVAATAGLAFGAGSPTDPSNLPLGDGHVSTTGASRGSIYICQASPGGPGGGGAFQDGPWIHGSTWSLTAKISVQGSVSWPNAMVSISVHGSKRTIVSNALPKGGTTGTFPIASSDPAYAYDRNPNSISPQSISWTLPVSPKAAAKPSCLSGGPIGIAVNGVPIFDGLDAQDRDAVAHEVQDSCGGHPQQSGMYHYHAISSCLLQGASTHAASPLVGYAIDGYPIYGPRGPGGKLYTDADLDVCHGHTVTTTVNGKLVKSYRYQATLEYPYTLGCFHGTPSVTVGGPP